MIDLRCGDSVEEMRTLADSSVDSIVVDPPYGLSEHRLKDVVACLTAWLAGEEYKPRKKGFMGKGWDAWVPGPEVFREALRVIKPGGHMLCFAGTRSMDLMMMAIRLAGWELRDGIGHAHEPGDLTQAAIMAWVYASGFPKNLDVAKAIDKAAGAEREVVGLKSVGNGNRKGEGFRHEGDTAGIEVTAPATEAAKQWDGWGTALKPAWEPIILARRPFAGTVIDNVLTHGTGALNIGACRIGWPEGKPPEVGTPGWGGPAKKLTAMPGQEGNTVVRSQPSDLGRWPANLIHDGSEGVLFGFPDTPGAKGDVAGDEPPEVAGQVLNARARVPYKRHDEPSANRMYEKSGGTDFRARPGDRRPPEAGSAARFFYCPKASTADRDEGLMHLPRPTQHGKLDPTSSMGKERAELGQGLTRNKHPTVKPTELMRYLVRLITPPGGAVLDFCAGSGSTGKAAELEGFSFIGIDNDPISIETARLRIGASAPLLRGVA